MRKLALFAAVCAAAVGAAGASAAPPEHHAIQVHDSFVAPFMSEACGVPVTITLDGVARVTLTRNSSGLVVREHDVIVVVHGCVRVAARARRHGAVVHESLAGRRDVRLRGRRGHRIDGGDHPDRRSRACGRRGIVGHGRIPAADGHRVRLLAGRDPARRLRRAGDLAARRVARLPRRSPPGALRGARRILATAAASEQAQWRGRVANRDTATLLTGLSFSVL